MREKLCNVQRGEYKLKTRVLWIDVGCLTDSLDQPSDYLKNEPHRLFKKTLIFSAPQWILGVTQYMA